MKKVYLNGVLLAEGADRDYEIKKSKIRFFMNLKNLDRVIVDVYKKGLLVSSKVFDEVGPLKIKKWKKFE